jgi:hypothetical protein
MQLISESNDIMDIYQVISKHCSFDDKTLQQKTTNEKRKIRISAVSHEERKMMGSPAGKAGHKIVILLTVTFNS